MSNKQLKKRSRRSLFGLVEDLDRQDEATAAADIHSQKRNNKVRRRSEAAQQQMRMYGKLVECRILLQRVLENTSSKESVNNTDDSVSPELEDLLVKLLQARQKLGSASIKKDTKDHPAEEEVSYSQIIRNNNNNNNKSDLERTLQMEYQDYRETWKTVLNSRHNDVKLRTGDLTNHKQFKVMDSTFWQQVEATAQHEHMSIREKKKKQQQDDDDDDWKFDDTKVYQQLLQDFVATQTDHGGANTGALVGRKNNQNPNSLQAKNRVDRRASKGRKIRYQEISKLVHYTFPISRPIVSDLDQDAWFQSLFGAARSNNINK
jgi:hypothetical protein